ncbi:MAG: hypothetical protein RBT41_11325 [Clostridia bacterium]|jgi:hypothetical protein|nr:hypothetical protein [Clostridia bacterium]
MMKIENSTLNMNSSHTSIEKQEVSESLMVWINGQGREIKDLVELTPEARNRLLLSAQQKNAAVAKTEPPAYEEVELSDDDKLKVQLLESFIEQLTGKKIRLRTPNLKLQKAPGNAPLQTLTVSGQGMPGFGLAYDYREYRYEKESMSFAAQGIVKTQDGREIHINLELNMTREFMSLNELHIRAGAMQKIDPLVINYAGALPALTETTFSFDLDADGETEQISFLAQGSGFLALDLNQDGKINDGRELFGPQSGDGFADLAQYDEDGNMWIDENDAIFHKLRIWTKDAAGNDYLLALGEVGIGAICLGSAASPFALKGQDNRLLGEIQKTGLFLRENGTAGTIQHIDLAV